MLPSASVKQTLVATEPPHGETTRRNGDDEIRQTQRQGADRLGDAPGTQRRELTRFDVVVRRKVTSPRRHLQAKHVNVKPSTTSSKVTRASIVQHVFHSSSRHLSFCPSFCISLAPPSQQQSTIFYSLHTPYSPLYKSRPSMRCTPTLALIFRFGITLK